MSGQFDYLIFLRCETHEQLDALLDFLGQIEGVNQTQTSVVLSRKLDRRHSTDMTIAAVSRDLIADSANGKRAALMPGPHANGSFAPEMTSGFDPSTKAV